MKAVCTKIKDLQFYPELGKIGAWYGDAERRIWQAIHVERQPVKTVKRDEVKENMTGRQFNSIRIDLAGKKQGLIEGLKRREEDLQCSIERYLEKIEAETKKFGIPAKSRIAHFKAHQFKRRVNTLTHRILEVHAELDAVAPSICFGSRELFYQQFNWQVHGFASFAAWQAAWKEVRSHHFYLVGTGKGKGGVSEVGGNQSCTLTLKNYDHANQVLEGTLRLRLPKCQETEATKYLNFEVSFSYNAQHLYNALLTEQPITYQWIKKGNRWHVHALVEEWKVPIISSRKHGGLGVDVNPLHLALGCISHDGNFLWVEDLAYNFKGLKKEARKALMGLMIKDIVLRAHRLKLPVIVEQLDFKAKKRELKSAGYNRMLSSFAYHQFHAMIRSTAATLGVEVIAINPRNTTTIGIVQFEGYGISKDQGAAIAIARRGLGFSERVRGRLVTALPLPAPKQLGRDKSRHVLASWSRLRWGLKLTRKGWQLSGKSRKVKALRDKPVGCRVRKQGRDAGSLSLKVPLTIGSLDQPSGDQVNLASDGLSCPSSDGLRCPYQVGNAVRPARSS